MEKDKSLGQLRKLFRLRVEAGGRPGSWETVIVGDREGQVFSPYEQHTIFAHKSGQEGYLFNRIRVAIPKQYQDIRFYPGERLVIEWDHPDIEGPKAHFIRKMPHDTP